MIARANAVMIRNHCGHLERRLMADKPDPFDVKALESAVNDSATRVSAIWISFLVFSLYLLIAAATVTQRQLLLAEPIKLPVLNIDLPLWGFFFLAPILLVIFHAYTLLQVLLLGRTAAAYNAAVARLELSPEENISLRQRLANTLFAQIFAGSPRERLGFIGWLLRTIVWITLAIAPILVVLSFQVSFLAYHSHIATWTHRSLILIELAIFFLMWPLALNAEKNSQWPDLKHLTVTARKLFGPKEEQRAARLRLRSLGALLVACVLYLLIPLSLLTFPGEPHINFVTGKPLAWVQCEYILGEEPFLSHRRWVFDRFNLRHMDVVDHAKLERIEKATEKTGEHPSKSERTYILRNRDLNCGDFSNADLRRVDLSDSSLKWATLEDVKLQGATLTRTNFEGAFLPFARLQFTELNFAQFRGAHLISAQLQSARADQAQFQGAYLPDTQLQGASLLSAELQGADLRFAHLEGAYLEGVQLQGADLSKARLRGAYLSDTELQGTDLSGADLDHSVLSQVGVWRARNADCTNARVLDPLTDKVIHHKGGGASIPAAPEEIDEFIKRVLAKIPIGDVNVARQMRNGLVVDPANDDTEAIAKVWKDCKEATSTIEIEKFDGERAEVLRNVVCGAPGQVARAVADGIIRNWICEATLAARKHNPTCCGRRGTRT